MTSVLLGRLPFDRSLPGHGRLRSVAVPPFSTRAHEDALFFHRLSQGRCLLGLAMNLGVVWVVAVPTVQKPGHGSRATGRRHGVDGNVILVTGKGPGACFLFLALWSGLIGGCRSTVQHPGTGGG